MNGKGVSVLTPEWIKAQEVCVVATEARNAPGWLVGLVLGIF
jgi:hypothetical protein